MASTAGLPLMQPMEFEREDLYEQPKWTYRIRRKVNTFRQRRWVFWGTIGFLVFVVLALFSSGSRSPWRTAGEVLSESPPGAAKLDIPQETVSEQTLWNERASIVKDAFERAYLFYDSVAAPHDELKPLTKGFVDNFNGWGVTMIDSLDSMLLMELYDLSNKTVARIAELSFIQDEAISTFETVIRYLGGLLSAYAITKHPVLLTKADELGRTLLPIFDTPSGLPYLYFDAARAIGSNRLENTVFLSEFASCQLEFRYLGKLTGRKEYIEHVDKVTDMVFDELTPDGLLPIKWDIISGEPELNGYFSLGAFGDSAYEYILKQFIQTNRTEPRFRSMHVATANGIIDNLLYLSPRRHLLFVTSLVTTRSVRRAHHLTCFYAGVLALGVQLMPDLPPVHAWAAEGLAHTCYVLYRDSETGLMPDEVEFRDEGELWVKVVKKWQDEGELRREGQSGRPPGVDDAVPVTDKEEREYTIVDAYHPLRPEAVESYYILYRLTGDVKWRERGWEQFQAIENKAKVSRGYAAIANVDQANAPKFDEMPSFFLAETLKYMYLLFSNADIVPLDNWVFNTEAHPLPVFEWTDWERERYGIKGTHSQAS